MQPCAAVSLTCHSAGARWELCLHRPAVRAQALEGLLAGVYFAERHPCCSTALLLVLEHCLPA